jgi:DNA-binding NarL/FixJ family response regulator
MVFSTKAQRASVHLLESGSVSVRTVHGRDPQYVRGGDGRPHETVTKKRHKRIMYLYRKGKTRREISEETGLSLGTISKHLNGRIKGI